MARMYPATLPASTTSAAEDRLFREFHTQLPHDWIVMHGVTWLNRRKQKDFRGEADFLIIHPLRGLLVLEVKGGRIEGEWSADTWTSTDRFGDVHLIKNPVKQVTGAMHDLRTKIKDAPATRPFSYPSYCGIAVPDVLASKQTFGVDWQRDLVIDSSNLPRLVDALEGMYSPEPPPAPMPKAAVDALVALLQPTVNLTRLGLVAEMRTGEQKILELSTYQSYALAMLRMHRRAVVNGCAGSGKTMLAIEKAIQLAEEGFSVVLTCFNKPLAGWMQVVIDRQPAAVRDLIRVSNYHDLAIKLCEEAGRPSTVLDGNPAYWNDLLPDQLAEAIPFLERRFDAIVVDEGQDIRDNWWITLESLLNDPDDGVLFIFQDPHQAIYHRSIDLPITTPPLDLPHNYRTTVSIHEQMVTYYPGHPVPVAIGPRGRPVDIIAATDDGLVKAIGKVLGQLIDEEGVTTDQIVILTPSSQKRSLLQSGTSVGNRTLAWTGPIGKDQILVSSIHAFKGLERDVVILAETRRLATMPTSRQLSYVAFSRAKHHLIVIGAIPDPIDAPLAEVNTPG
jgi:hypothetical protein